MEFFLKDFDPIDEEPRTGFQAFNVEMRVEDKPNLELLINVLSGLNCNQEIIDKLQGRLNEINQG
jgi:hypothetical protein